MTNTQKKILAEKWLESLNDEYKLYYVKLLQVIADNGGDVVESAYKFMLSHKKLVFNNSISKLKSYQITRSMFPKGIVGWFSWLIAYSSASDMRPKPLTAAELQEQSNKKFLKDYERATSTAMEKAVNNVRFYDQRPSATLGQVSGDYLR